MNAAASNTPDNGDRLKSLFTEIGELKKQRRELMRRLAECQRENLSLREEIAWLRGGPND